MRMLRLYVPVCALSLVCLLYAQSDGDLTQGQRISRIRDLSKRDFRAIPAIADSLSDPSRQVRIEAVKAIVKIGTEASLTPLVKATHDTDIEVQIRATDGIVNYYVPGYVTKGLTGPVTRGVRQAQSFFGARNNQVIDPDIAVRPDVQQAIAAEIAGGADVNARSNAARAAGILRDREAVPVLADSVHAKENQLIIESLIALQKIHDPAPCARVGSAARDLDERVQTTALETVGVLHCVDSAPDVRSALNDARNTRVRRAALEALAMLAVPSDRATFQQYATSQDDGSRAAALEGLGRIRQPEDFAVLEQAYNEKDTDWKVHLAAAFGMVNQGKVDSGEFSPLPYLFESLDVSARADAATAYLEELARHEDVRRALFAMVGDASKDQKIALCSVLAGSHADDVVPTLNSLSKDVNPDVSLAATRALRIIQSRPARA